MRRRTWIGLGAGLRTEPSFAAPSILYSPRFRLIRTPRPGGQAIDDAPREPSEAPAVRIRLLSPFLESGGLANMSDELREQLKKLGYLEESRNQQN